MKALFCAVWMWFAGCAAAEAGELPFLPDTPYYFEHFDPQQSPWQPGHDLNIEEVFKNYQYYEIRFAKDKREFLVTFYIQGRKEGSERYRIKADGALEKRP